QGSLLEKPIDPRVDRILDEIYEDKAAAERALDARRIIEFRHGDSGERHVIQDERGFWCIVPGPAPTFVGSPESRPTAIFRARYAEKYPASRFCNFGRCQSLPVRIFSQFLWPPLLC